MKGKTHATIGTIAGYILAGDILGAAAGLIGGLLPDIDHEQSILGQRFWLIAAPLRRLIGHRSLTHSLLAVAAAGWAAWTFQGHWWAFALGYGLHLLCDMTTVAGIQLLYPLPYRIRFPVIWRLSGLVEGLTLVACFVGFVVSFVGLQNLSKLAMLVVF